MSALEWVECVVGSMLAIFACLGMAAFLAVVPRKQDRHCQHESIIDLCERDYNCPSVKDANYCKAKQQSFEYDYNCPSIKTKSEDRAPEYKAFYNDQAYKMIEWMYAENNRTKQAKLYRTACRMEKRFRDYYNVPENRPWSNGCTVTLPRPMPSRPAPPKGGSGVCDGKK